MDKLVDRWAMKLAVGNNGGSWDSHYTEKHKTFWRERAIEFIVEVWSDFEKSERGEMYARIGMPDEAEFGPRPAQEK
jgi:hypothetical protein